MRRLELVIPISLVLIFFLLYTSFRNISDPLLLLTTVPLALRYEFMSAERPHLFVDIGAALPPQRDVKAGRDAHEGKVTEALDRIDAALREGDLARYETVLRAPDARLARLAERALAWMTRP